MPLSSTTITSAVSAAATKTIGQSSVTAKTEYNNTYRFANGTGASQATDVIDACITANNVAVALSTLTNTLGESFGNKTELKSITFYNPATNTGNITVSSNITGCPGGVLRPDSEINYHSNDATGLTITSANTITANGTVTSENLRVIFLAN